MIAESDQRGQQPVKKDRPLEEYQVKCRAVPLIDGSGRRIVSDGRDDIGKSALG